MASRTVVIDGKRVSFNDEDASSVVGKGGEATVFHYAGGEAVKIFHEIDPSLPRDEKRLRTAALDLKRRKLQNFPKGLPSGVPSPRGLVYDTKGTTVVGYRMPFEAGNPFFKLADIAERATYGIKQPIVVDLFKDLRRILSGMHAMDVIVGDLNDGNELFRLKPNPTTILIDVDSFQFGSFPCIVAAQRFLDPRLYGVDLGKGLFTKETDWYAFAVLLFQSLLCAEPFGGLHPKVRTYLRRAEARISILNPQVKYNFQIKPDTLPDDLMQFFVQVFEKDCRDVFPERLLAFRWTHCPNCGTEHARAKCPKCAAPGAVVEAIRFNRKCKATRVFGTKGQIRMLKVEQGSIKVVYEENDNFYREDRKQIWEGELPPHARLTIQGRATWLGVDSGTMLLIQDEQAIDKTTTDILGNLPVFDSTAATVYRIKNGYLYRGDTPLGTVLQGRTWLRTGEEFGLCFARASNNWYVQVFEHTSPGLKAVNVPPPQGKLRDAEAVFSDTHVLLLISEDRGGKLWNTMHLISKDGVLEGSAEGDPSTVRMLQSIRGKALLRNKILTSTDEGLLQLAVTAGTTQIDEVKLFEDASAFVQAGTQIYANPQGKVWYATQQEVFLLELQ